MKKSTKNTLSILFAVIICALALLCCVARYFPTNVGQVYDIDAPVVDALQAEDILLMSNCELDEQSNYKITGVDPQFVFSTTTNDIKTIKFNLAAPAKVTVPFEIYVALEGEGFTAEKCYVSCVFKNETSAVVGIPNGNYESIRVDIDDDSGVVFKNLELYNQEPITVPYIPHRTTKGYVLTVIIPLLCGIVAFFAIKHSRLCENTVETIKKNIKSITAFLILSCAAVPASALVERTLANLNRHGEFSIYKWMFFFGIIEIAIIFVLMRKQLAQKPENIFLALAFTIGFVMFFATPIQHVCWDLDSHYPWVIQSSFSDMAYLTGADVCIDNVAPQSLFESDFTLASYKEDLAYINSQDGMILKQLEADITIAHLPAGIIIAVARMFGASFAVKYTLGRVTYLLVYVFVCYAAIKKIKSGKMILATICLFPTSLFLATNYAQDGYVTAFTILGTAYFVNELQQPNKPITLKDTIIMCCAFVMGALPKLIYIVLMGMTLFMCKNWQDKAARRRYYYIIISIFALMFFYFAMVSLAKTGQGGDARGGNVNPVEQIKFILTSPMEYAKILLNFLKDYLSVRWMQQYISNFARMGIGNWWPVFVVLIAFTTLTDASSEVDFKIPWWMKSLAVLLFVGMASLIATALFIDFTPVGSQTILGCQGRYIIPLLAPLLLLISGQRWNIVKDKRVYNGLVLLAASIAAMMDIYTVAIAKMI